MEQLNHAVQVLGIDGCDHLLLFKYIAQQLKLKRPSYVVLILMGIMVLLMMCGIFPKFVSGLSGFIYPAYKTIETIDYRVVVAEKQWLTYWILYCILMVFDSTLATIFGFLPFFHLFKTLFLVYLYHPSYLGALRLYEQVFSPYYQKYEQEIDSHLEGLKQNYDLMKY